jgi:hypothetical protein
VSRHCCTINNFSNTAIASMHNKNNSKQITNWMLLAIDNPNQCIAATTTNWFSQLQPWFYNGAPRNINHISECRWMKSKKNSESQAKATMWSSKWPFLWSIQALQLIPLTATCLRMVARASFTKLCESEEECVNGLHLMSKEAVDSADASTIILSWIHICGKLCLQEDEGNVCRLEFHIGDFANRSKLRTMHYGENYLQFRASWSHVCLWEQCDSFCFFWKFRISLYSSYSFILLWFHFTF